MSFISNVGAYTYTDGKISALAVAPSPYNNTGNNYNLVYIGTSNGQIYLFNEQSNTIQSVVPTGYNGTLSGEITGLAVDPAGKYLFVNAPTDRHCLRISLTSIQFTGNSQTLIAPIDRDIYQFGDNTGDIVVDSQGVIYLVTGNGLSISTMERYGNSFVDLLFENEGPALNFKGISLSPNEQRIYAADTQFGSVYYYDFLSNQPTFDFLSTPGVYSKLTGLATSGNNVFYTHRDGIYTNNSYIGTLVRVAGNGLSTYVPTTEPQRFTLSGTNTVTADSFGNIYLSSSNVFGQSQLYKVSFALIARQGYQPPPPRQEQPIIQPYPTTSCKKILEPFSPRIRFGWGLTNTRKPPILDVFKSPLCCPPPIVNCPVTPFYCLPSPPPPFPSEPVAPIYPTTVSTRQFGDHAIGNGSRTSIYTDAAVLTNAGLTFTAEASVVQAALGPLGEVYYLCDTGTLNKIYNGNSEWSFFTNTPTTTAGPVVSSTGAIIVTTDYGSIYRLDSNAKIFSNYPIHLGQQIGGSPACITNPAFDSIFACYGNTIGAFTASNASRVWSTTTQTLGELFKTSVATDGINVFAGTNNSKVYCFVAETGSLNWVYNVPTAGVVFTPYTTAKNIGVTVQNDSNIFILSNATVRQAGLDITVTFRGMRIVSPPVISTDSRGLLWAHVITSTGYLYGFGGIFLGSDGNSYQYVWSNSSTDKIPGTYKIPVIDSAGYIYTSSVYGVVNQYNAYYTGGRTQLKNTSLIVNGTETALNRPIQVSLTPLITSQNIMYVIGRDTLTTSPAYRTNYLYTLSGPPVIPVVPVVPVVPTWYRAISAPSLAWNSIASSSDRMNLVAVVNGGGIYTSSNYGDTWTQTSAPSKFWKSIASSSNGMKLVAIVNGGGIYTSSDYGENWTLQTTAPTATWTSIASSSDGTKLVGTATLLGIYTSSNSGSTWTKTSAPPVRWTSITSSSDGTKLAAAIGGGGIYTNANSGTGDWISSSAPTSFWASIASSSDGTKLAAAMYSGGIYTNTNSGVGAWTLQTTVPTDVEWMSIASSSDGTKLAAVLNGGGIYMNSNSGVGAWTLQTTVPTDIEWSSIVSSSDGTELAAVVPGGGVYLYS
jgi:hypothetical protein